MKGRIDRNVLAVKRNEESQRLISAIVHFQCLYCFETKEREKLFDSMNWKESECDLPLFGRFGNQRSASSFIENILVLLFAFQHFCQSRIVQLIFLFGCAEANQIMSFINRIAAKGE
jgi:hypothetical protein